MTSSLAQFVERFPFVEHNWDSSEIYLYHGTNCYRRLEIRMAGEIDLGRSGLVFLCSNADRAYDYAKVATLRDESYGFRNSLSHEAILLKVKFDSRTFLDVDFVRNLDSSIRGIGGDLLLAINKSIKAERVVEVLHCEHGLEFLQDIRSMRSVDEERLMQGIKHLRGQSSQLHPEIWAARRLAEIEPKSGRTPCPELTVDDELRRLRTRRPR